MCWAAERPRSLVFLDRARDVREFLRRLQREPANPLHTPEPGLLTFRELPGPEPDRLHRLLQRCPPPQVLEKLPVAQRVEPRRLGRKVGGEERPGLVQEPVPKLLLDPIRDAP